MPADEGKLTRSSLDFPSNSETKTDKKLKPIVKGRVTKRKKGLIQRIRESIVNNDNQSIGDYLIFDILLPAAKSTISDIVSSGVDMMLFGERRHRPNIRRDGTRSYSVPYNSYFSGSERAPSTPRPFDSSSRNRHDFENIVFDSRGEAEDVLSRLTEHIDEYGLVTVADFYDLCNIPSNFTDNKYGWNSLKEAFTERVRDGYSIRLPRTRPLD